MYLIHGRLSCNIQRCRCVQSEIDFFKHHDDLYTNPVLAPKFILLVYFSSSLRSFVLRAFNLFFKRFVVILGNKSMCLDNNKSRKIFFSSRSWFIIYHKAGEARYIWIHSIMNSLSLLLAVVWLASFERRSFVQEGSEQ